MAVLLELAPMTFPTSPPTEDDPSTATDAPDRLIDRPEYPNPDDPSDVYATTNLAGCGRVRDRPPTYQSDNSAYFARPAAVNGHVRCHRLQDGVGTFTDNPAHLSRIIYM
ncbi:MAG: hypothetical protein U5K37_08815 [Natrialbaceae archaeon]|nr:hypothetical protein [Natrialbaceae archaeon]